MSKHDTNLDYTIPMIDISKNELEDIIADADNIIMNNNETPEKLAMAYLKKVQCLQKIHECTGFANLEILYQVNILIDKALEIFTDMPEALMQAGKLYYKLSKMQNNFLLDEAINLYTRAIKIKPDYAAAFNNRGTVYASLPGNYQASWEKAIADFSEAIRIRPLDAIYYLNRAGQYSKLKEPEKAIADFTSAINHGSDEFKRNILVFYFRGQEYMQIKDYKKAIDDFSESIRLRPDKIKAIASRGKAYLLAGEKDKAKADFDEYLRWKLERNTKDMTKFIIDSESKTVYNKVKFSIGGNL